MAHYKITNIEKTLETITTERKIVFILLEITEEERESNTIEKTRANEIIGHYLGAIDLLDFQLSINK